MPITVSLEHMPEHSQITVIFPVLKEGLFQPYFTVYAKDRDMVQSYHGQARC